MVFLDTRKHTLSKSLTTPRTKFRHDLRLLPETKSTARSKAKIRIRISQQVISQHKYRQDTLRFLYLLSRVSTAIGVTQIQAHLHLL